MKFITILFTVFFTSTSLIAQIAITPTSGDGTINNPYEIASLENLYWIAAPSDIVPNPDQDIRWSNHYIQSADIDASETEQWFNGQGWLPIGIFTGSYNGQNHLIKELWLNRIDTDTIGLFSINDETIVKNSGLADVNIRGRNIVGSIVGNQFDSGVFNCYSTVSVIGYNHVGGLVGKQRYSGVINSFSMCSVSANGSYVGRLLGHQGHADIIDSYSVGNVTGDSHVGGLIGWQDDCSEVSNGYWNVETSNQTESHGGDGRSTEEMTYPYTTNTFIDWDFELIWAVDENHSVNYGYHYLRDMH